MKGLSGKEVELIAALEYDHKQFFTSEDIDKIAKDKRQRYNIVKALLKKKRIVKLNKTKYYLIPFKAKHGSWSEDPFVVADEACDGNNYFIGGWGAAYHWKLTEQIPMQVDIYTTKRQGKLKILNTRLVFHRTTAKKIEQAVVEKKREHPFRIMNKEEAKIWIRSRK
ncbi:MAG: hypothetical protein AABX82_02475 [Nanoarchaeota archaeon]